MLILLLVLTLTQKHLVICHDLLDENNDDDDNNNNSNGFDDGQNHDYEQSTLLGSDARRLYCLECKRSCPALAKLRPKNYFNMANNVDDDEINNNGNSNIKENFKGALECKCKAIFDFGSNQVKCKNMAKAQVQAIGQQQQQQQQQSDLNGQFNDEAEGVRLQAQAQARSRTQNSRTRALGAKLKSDANNNYRLALGH